MSSKKEAMKRRELVRQITDFLPQTDQIPEQSERLRKLLATITQTAQLMEEAMSASDDQVFGHACGLWRIAQEKWLETAQEMTPQQARETMADFAKQELTRWMNDRRPGPPPTILSRYETLLWLI